MSTDTIPARSTAPALAAAVGAFIAVVVACTAAGATFATKLLSNPDAHAPAGAPGPFRVAQDVPTSFGFVAVEHAETELGLTAKQLAGAVHGIGDFVGRDKVLVQASITLTNAAPATVDYSPRQFRLVARQGKVVRRYAVSHASIRPGTLQPDAAVDARLSFAAPRDGSRLALEFADPGSEHPIVIDVGRRTGRATARDKAAAHHGKAAKVPNPGAAPVGQDHDH
jgi:hypothetical protein